MRIKPKRLVSKPQLSCFILSFITADFGHPYRCFTDLKNFEMKKITIVQKQVLF